MKRAEFASVSCAGIVVYLACCLTPAVPVLADPPNDWCAPDSPFGNAGTGHTLEIPPGGYDEMDGDEDWHTVIVNEGATLNTRGNRLRVCCVLINHGTITDSYSGGTGGPGGVGGRGHDPWEDDDPAYCDLQPLCTDGEDGDAGSAPLVPQPGDNGRGGHGGCGGGGGGGARWIVWPLNYDTDGGNGGNGGVGGKGGPQCRVGGRVPPGPSAASARPEHHKERVAGRGTPGPIGAAQAGLRGPAYRACRRRFAVIGAF